jgi:predicted TIM-barrel fold metal-dependent hydrolase
MPTTDTPWIIDADGHVVEPDEMWEGRLADEHLHLAPRLRPVLEPDSPLRLDDAEGGALARMFERTGGYDPASRLPDLDTDLIQAAVIFPTLGLMIDKVTEPVAARALHRAANDWMAEYCSLDPKRLIGVGALPSTDATDALTEARRCIEDLGLRAVFKHPPLREHGVAIHDPAHEPLWDYLEANDVPILCHSGSPPPYYQQRFPDGFLASHALHFMTEAMAAFTSFAMYGILERHPALRVGFVEAGALWVPAYCHRLDEHLEKALEGKVHYSVPRNEKLSLTPTEYFQRQCFVTVEEVEPGLPAMLEDFPGNVMFSTDYPHPDGVFPGSTANLLGSDAITDDQRRAVLRDNAIRLYALDGIL